VSTGVERILGPLESAIMRVLWKTADATVLMVSTRLNEGRERPLAYTTVMTVLVRLHEKALVTRRFEGRGYVYGAALTENELIDSASARAVDDLVRRFGTPALVHFAERLDRLDPEARAELARLATRTSEKDVP
jgi:predicted transcriptional regulator